MAAGLLARKRLLVLADGALLCEVPASLHDSALP